MSKRQRFLKAKNYALFYGADRSSELSNFDVAIVEPLGQNNESLEILHKAGTLVLAYLSVMEVHQNSNDFHLVDENDFLRIDGTPLKNKTYGTYILNPAAKTWSRLLYHNAGKLLLHNGYDGLFLDTIDAAELSGLPPGTRKMLVHSIVEYIRQLRKLDDDFIIVQNNGVERVCLHTSSLIDGICWENPPFAGKESELWVRRVLKRLETLKNENPLHILLLLEEPEDRSKNAIGYFLDNIETARKIADNKSFLLYRAPSKYTGGVTPLIT